MPWHDWQFWVVSVVFVAAIAFMARQVLPRRRGGACGSCGPTVSRGRKVEITVEKKGLRD